MKNKEMEKEEREKRRRRKEGRDGGRKGERGGVGKKGSERWRERRMTPSYLVGVPNEEALSPGCNLHVHYQ